MGEQNGYLPFPKGFATAAIHHSQEPEQWDSMAVVAPLVTSTTFKQFGPADYKKYEYGRSGNPTREVLESILAKLDNGLYGLTFSSGLGATSAVLGLLKNGDSIIVGDDLVWIETPTNPTFKVVDIKAVSEVTKKDKITLIVDNTFVTPYLQRPLELGADLVIYSLTKYMNGHSDVIMGSITTSNKELYEQLQFLQNAMGIVPSPFDCYQVTRSLKTLSLRMEKHQKNALTIAKYLEAHPKVIKVLHPVFKSVMTHASVPPELRKTLGISDSLIRLSVGIEDVEDLVADLEQALKKVGSKLQDGIN
ncbi:hypothetical protein NQ314_015139 [Rhamnusium bicolor]|uniref:cystathionine gamma-lyase n=1 Tax=Rhamnusium bicolor TaxID=1586634 RepID=A0AAV8WZN6_9CUCU|nr:hypothetical protein NQ314_015139 [Rhamnusium bicolor]